MRRQWCIGVVIGFVLGNLASQVWANHGIMSLMLGDGTFPSLQIWGFIDRVVNARLFISTTAGPDEDTPTLLYTLAPNGILGVRSAFSANTRTEGKAEGVGGFLYAETAGEGGVAGGNAHAATFSGAPAIGLEVNGINFSGNPHAAVRGIDIVNGGNAQTQWALGIETSFARPQGKPKVGIMLAGPSQGFLYPPASDTGIVIGEIDAQEAIRIQKDHRIAFNNEGTVYMKYNSQTNRVEFYNGSTLKHAIPME
jgi:hypothetical protein